MTPVTRFQGLRTLLSSARVRGYARAAVGAGILAAIAAHIGAEPFVAGIAAVTPQAAATAVILGAAATVAAAWRWRILADRLGVGLSWTPAVSAYYRSQFLNSVLPGGVVGDVHRAVSHGRDAGALGQASRAVVAERSAGQLVQLGIAAIALVSLQAWAYAPAVGVALLAAAIVAVGLLFATAVNRRARRAVQRELAAIRLAFTGWRVIAQVAAASVIVVVCHVATFLVACLAVGVVAAPERLVAVALIAVLAGSIPMSIGGWGPREGVVAWAFAVTGLGAAAGIAASTAFGVLALIAVAPGAAVVATSARRRRVRIAEAG